MFGSTYGASGAEKFTFAGEMMDSPSGLFYLFARYYDPNIGRFVSLDPLLGSPGDPQTLDRYVYCANNPLSYTDPTGFEMSEIASRHHRGGFARTYAADYGICGDGTIDPYFYDATLKKQNAITNGDYGWADGVGVDWAPSSLDMAMRFIQIIPIVGVVGSAYFAIQSAQQGDYVGCLLNIGIGALQIAPFIPLGQIGKVLAGTGSSAITKVTSQANKFVATGKSYMGGYYQTLKFSQVTQSIRGGASSAVNWIKMGYYSNPQFWNFVIESPITG